MTSDWTIKDSEAVYFVATSRPELARAFYQDQLGLPLVADEPFALVFSLAGRMLRVAKVQSFEPARRWPGSRILTATPCPSPSFPMIDADGRALHAIKLLQWRGTWR
jgi:catechol 2,3-dioxygenase-like lactoylglutathione lyase family enzyme